LESLHAGKHFCGIYKSEQEHRALLTPFLCEGLAANEKVLYIADAHSPDLILDYVRAGGLDPEPYVERGALSIRTVEETYLGAGGFSPRHMIALLRGELERAAGEGYAGLRATGECTRVARHAPREWLEYEDSLNSLAASHSLILLCQYDHRQFAAAAELRPAELAIAYIDASRRMRFVNRVSEHWAGFAPGVAGQHLCEVLGEAAYHEALPHLEAALAGRQVAFETVRNGSPVVATYSPHIDAGGEIRGLFAILRDSNEQELDLSQAGRDRDMLRDILDCLPLMVGWTDPAGVLALANREWERVLGVGSACLPPAGLPVEGWRDCDTLARDGRLLDVAWVGVPTPDGGRLAIGRDISERKQAERALRRSEEFYRTLVENAPDCLLVLDPDGAICYASPAAERALGHPRERLVGSRLYSYVPIEDGPRLLELFEKLAASPGAERELTVQFCRPDGSVCRLEGAVQNLRHVRPPGGIVLRCRGQAAAASAARQDLWREIVDNVPVMVALIDAAGRCRFTNREWSRVMGWSLDEIGPDEVFARCYPDPERRREVADFIAASTGERREFRAVARDGGVVDACWIYLRLADGGAIGIGQDLSALKQAQAERRSAEELFRSLVENTRDLIWVLDPDGRIRYASPAVKPVLDYDPAELTGGSAFDLIHPDDLSRVREAFDRALEQPGPAEPVEHRARRRDGSWRVLESVGDNLIHIESPGGIVVTSRDITERREMETHLRHAQRMEAVGHLAGGIAHEFSNLLGVILCYSDLMLQDVEPGNPMRADLEQIRTAAERASDVTGQLLSFSRRQPVRLQSLDLNPVVARMARLLAPVLGEPIEIETALSLQPAVARVDQAQFEQVLLNLALNARDAMPGGGVISIETRPVRLRDRNPAGLPPGDYVMVRFSDNGCGMDEATRAHAFEPFFTTKEQGRGTGLGLPTIYGVLQEHNGAIAMESEPGIGSTFRLWFPQ
jgi:PAS domain S-box-containing protein